MPESKSQAGDLFIVDNSDKDWKVRRYLRDWTDVAQSIDIATGYFEIGSLLALDGQWQKLEKVRILMGDEVSKRTRKALLAGIEHAKKKLDDSIEREKEKNDFLLGVPAIVDALTKKQIECRSYTKEKFHAKAYITHAKLAVVGPTALVGSSNFTVPGITDNVELNVQIRREVEVLQEWYERHWDEAQDITPEILRVIERHTREYSPFEVYAKALQEFFRGHEITAEEWENTKSRMFPVLDQYQKEGYRALLKIGRRYGGAFLCDAVGLGKTFVGLMLIERLVDYDRKRVALFVPKSARDPVWETFFRRYLPHVSGVYSNLLIFNHTDLLRGGHYQRDLDRVKEMADVIVIDEAHHFRNPGIRGEDGDFRSHYWRLFDICDGKTLYLLTATPVNNRLIDLQHMIELFSRRQADFFKEAPLGIHSLPGHFRKMENELERLVLEREAGGEGIETNQVEAEKVLLNDALFRAIVVQRSRAYVKQSQKQHGGNKVIFPKRADPIVVKYSIEKTYGRLLGMFEQAFNKAKPLFSLAIYYPLAYYKGPDTNIDPLKEGRQKEVVSLIRIQFLKRFESSARAFEVSCVNLLLKLLTWVTKHSKSEGEQRRLDKWKTRHSDLIQYIQDQNKEFFPGEPEAEAEEDIVTPEMLEAVEELPREEYKIEEILAESYDDLEELADFLDELKKFRPAQDDKLNSLMQLLKSDAVLKNHKVLIFSEFMATARYLRQRLEREGISDLDEVDSAVKRDRGEIITRFAPYYNGSSTAALQAEGLSETRVLISTDVLSEGLNLQDATRLINYDLHWNPVRLMQRIGRVDRRMNQDIEDQIIADHPGEETVRSTVAFWNFLPPKELDRLLQLYQRVAHKALRISKTFGIEGKKLLKPEDDYEALKDFNHTYEGAPSALETMHLEFQKLLQDNPGLEDRLAALPGRVFSGKEHPSPGARAVFFCYALPAPPAESREAATSEAEVWTEEAGHTRWYLFDLASEKITEEPSEIINLIRSTSNTPRHRAIADKTLSEIRARIEKRIKNTYLKQVQAPIGVKPKLKAWMELS
jgi:superfamily II DNA/RNA helicase